jgi:predicted RNase H-like HicB family nuclease
MEHEFTVIIERDAESGWLVGSVTELPGCYTQAPTLAELDVNIREAVAVYLATVEEDLTMAPSFVGLQRLSVTV